MELRPRVLTRQMCPARLVSLRDDVGWPARSPDSSICEIVLWEGGGYLKENVFKNRLRALEELKDRIWVEINAIAVEM